MWLLHTLSDTDDANWIIEYGRSKMAGVSSSFLVINGVIQTSWILLKIIYMLANFLILSGTLLWSNFSFMFTQCASREIWNMPIIQQYDVMLTSDYVNVSIKLCLKLRNDVYILCIILVAVAWAAVKL